MCDWLKRIFGQPDDDERQRFFDMIDALNAEAAGSAPTTIERQLGTLEIRSGVLAFGDPQDLPSLELPNIDTDEASICGKLWQYPSGGARVIGLTIGLGNESQCDVPRKIGELGIDSAALVAVMVVTMCIADFPATFRDACSLTSSTMLPMNDRKITMPCTGVAVVSVSRIQCQLPPPGAGRSSRLARRGGEGSCAVWKPMRGRGDAGGGSIRRRIAATKD